MSHLSYCFSCSFACVFFCARRPRFEITNGVARKKTFRCLSKGNKEAKKTCTHRRTGAERDKLWNEKKEKHFANRVEKSFLSFHRRSLFLFRLRLKAINLLLVALHNKFLRLPSDARTLMELRLRAVLLSSACACIKKGARATCDRDFLLQLAHSRRICKNSWEKFLRGKLHEAFQVLVLIDSENNQFQASVRYRKSRPTRRPKLIWNIFLDTREES